MFGITGFFTYLFRNLLRVNNLDYTEACVGCTNTHFVLCIFILAHFVRNILIMN